MHRLVQPRTQKVVEPFRRLGIVVLEPFDRVSRRIEFHCVEHARQLDIHWMWRSAILPIDSDSREAAIRTVFGYSEIFEPGEFNQQDARFVTVCAALEERPCAYRATQEYAYGDARRRRQIVRVVLGWVGISDELIAIASISKFAANLERLAWYAGPSPEDVAARDPRRFVDALIAPAVPLDAEWEEGNKAFEACERIAPQLQIELERRALPPQHDQITAYDQDFDNAGASLVLAVFRLFCGSGSEEPPASTVRVPAPSLGFRIA